MVGLTFKIFSIFVWRMKMCFHEKTLSPIPGGIPLRLGYGKCGGIDAKDAAERAFQPSHCTGQPAHVFSQEKRHGRIRAKHWSTSD